MLLYIYLFQNHCYENIILSFKLFSHKNTQISDVYLVVMISESSFFIKNAKISLIEVEISSID